VSTDRPAALRYALATFVALVTLAVLVGTGATRSVDAAVVEWSASLTAARPELLAALRLLEEVTRPVWLYAVATPLCLLTGWRAGMWQRAGAAWVTMMTIWGSAALLKLVVGRDRPPWALTPQEGLSFPSGHATNSTAVMVGMAMLLWPLLGTLERRLLAVAAAVIIAAVMLNRVFLGVHYPTDVLAGLLYGGGLMLASARLWPPR